MVRKAYGFSKTVLELMKTFIHNKRGFPVWPCLAALLAAVLAAQAAAMARSVSPHGYNDAFLSAADVLLSQVYLEPEPSCLALATRNERAEPDSVALLLKAIIQVESSGDTMAVGKAGERGLMQIKRDTWRETTSSMYGHELPFDYAFDGDLNRHVGRQYLARIQQRLKERRPAWKADQRALLLASYNAGPHRVVRSGFDLRRVPARTRDYVARVTALHDYYLRHGGEPHIVASGPPTSGAGALRLARAGR